MTGDASAAASRRARLFAGGLMLVTLLAYLPVLLHGGYVWDDASYLTQNPLLRSGAGFLRIWVPGNTPQYYPLVFSSFWLEYRLWGLDPHGYHLVNVLLHAANSYLVFRLFRAIGVPGAWILGALFALHPVQVESVAWITERKNVLSAFFYLLSALAYLAYDREPESGRGGRAYVAALGLLVCALLSKSVACSLPVALLLAIAYERKPLDWRRLRSLIPFFLFGLLLAWNTVRLERDMVGAAGPEFDRSFLDRVLVAGRALVFYVGKLLWPERLIFVYPRFRGSDSLVATVGPLVLVLLAIATMLWSWRRGGRGIVLGLTFYAITVFPALGFANVYPHRFSFVADHFVYLASLGVLALVAAALDRVARHGRVALCAVIGLLAVLGVRTGGRSRVYESEETLWRATLADNDEAWIAHLNLTSLLLGRAQQASALHADAVFTAAVAEAESHAQRAVVLQPHHFGAYTNLAEALRLGDRPQEALVAQERAVRLLAEDPHRDLPAGRQARAFLDHQRGRILWRLGRLDEAEGAYVGALHLTPGATDVVRELEQLESARGASR